MCFCTEIRGNLSAAVPTRICFCPRAVAFTTFFIHVNLVFQRILQSLLFVCTASPFFLAIDSIDSFANALHCQPRHSLPSNAFDCMIKTSQLASCLRKQVEFPVTCAQATACTPQNPPSTAILGHSICSSLSSALTTHRDGTGASTQKRYSSHICSSPVASCTTSWRL